MTTASRFSVCRALRIFLVGGGAFCLPASYAHADPAVDEPQTQADAQETVPDEAEITVKPVQMHAPRRKPLKITIPNLELLNQKKPAFANTDRDNSDLSNDDGEHESSRSGGDSHASRNAKKGEATGFFAKIASLFDADVVYSFPSQKTRAFERDIFAPNTQDMGSRIASVIADDDAVQALDDIIEKSDDVSFVNTDERESYVLVKKLGTRQVSPQDKKDKNRIAQNMAPKTTRVKTKQAEKTDFKPVVKADVIRDYKPLPKAEPAIPAMAIADIPEMQEDVAPQLRPITRPENRSGNWKLEVAKAKEEAWLKEQNDLKAKAEAKVRADAEAKALAEAKEKAQAKAKEEQEAKLRAEAETKARAELELKLRAEAEAKEKAELQARLRAEEEAKLRAQAETKARAEAEAKALAEAKAKAEQEARLRAEEEAKLRAQAEAKARAEAESKALAEAKEKAELQARLRAEEEAKLRAQAEAKARAEAEAKALAEAKEKAELQARLRAEEEAKLRAQAEAKARAEAEAKALAEAKEKAELQARLRAEEEAKLRAQAEAKARAEAEAKALAEAKEKAKLEARLRAEEEAKLRAQAEAKARAEAEAKALTEAKEKAELQARLRAEEEAKLRAEAEEKARAEAEAKAKAQAEALAEAKAMEEFKAKIKLEAEAKVKAEFETKLRAEAEAKVRAEMQAKAQADAKLQVEKAKELHMAAAQEIESQKLLHSMGAVIKRETSRLSLDDTKEMQTASIVPKVDARFLAGLAPSAGSDQTADIPATPPVVAPSAPIIATPNIAPAPAPVPTAAAPPVAAAPVAAPPVTPPLITPLAAAPPQPAAPAPKAPPATPAPPPDAPIAVTPPPVATAPAKLQPVTAIEVPQTPTPILPPPSPLKSTNEPLDNGVDGDVKFSKETKDLVKKLPSNLGQQGNANQEKFYVDRSRETSASDGAVQAKSATANENMDLKIAMKKPTYNVDYELEKAYNALIGGESETAVNIYKSVLTNDPDNENALFGLATAYHRVGEVSKARPYYAKLLEINPKNRDGLNNFLALLAKESPQAALSQLRELGERNPGFSPIQAQMAVINQKLGDLDGAADNMRRAIELSPENLTYRYNLAIIYDKQQKYDDAAPLYRQVVEAAQHGESIPGNVQKIQQRLTFISSNRP